MNKTIKSLTPPVRCYKAPACKLSPVSPGCFVCASVRNESFEENDLELDWSSSLLGTPDAIDFIMGA